MTSNTSPLLNKGLFGKFALLFLPLAVLLTAVILPITQSYESGRISIIKARESGYLDLSKRLVTSEFNRVMGDLQAFIRDPLLSQYVDMDIKKFRSELAELLKIHSEGYKRYDQIRLLDLSGHEVIRVNYRDGNAIVVPDVELQNKKSRYYFSEAIKLRQGEVYVSPLDLNVEHGKIELPYKPTIRFAAPLFDRNGKPQGVMVLNYLADILLTAFHNDMQKNPLHQAMLLNSDGYWVSSPNKEQEWGFMLKRDDLRFSHTLPEAWKYISEKESGETSTTEGLLLFTTIYPLRMNSLVRDLQPGSAKQIQEYYWKVILKIPTESLYATSFIRHGQGRVLLVAIYFLLAVSAFLVVLFIEHSKQRREQERKSAREIEDLYNNAPCGYHSLDSSGLIVKMNQTELNWLGYSAEEIIGKKHYLELLTDSSKEHFQKRFPEFLQLGFIHDEEFEVLRKDGSMIPIMVSATAVRDERGRIIKSRSTVFDMTDRKRMEQQLLEQATTDFLTGLNNRRNFYYLAEVELIRTQRTGKSLSLLVLDIDHFKQINDTYGHEAGDKALQLFSAICHAELREIDILGRIGGEEFAALLPETGGETAIEVAHRLCKAISTTSFTVPDDINLTMTVSIGITRRIRADHTIHDMLKRADNALYTAKKGGRNQVCYEDPDTAADTCSAP